MEEGKGKERRLTIGRVLEAGGGGRKEPVQVDDLRVRLGPVADEDKEAPVRGDQVVRDERRNARVQRLAAPLRVRSRHRSACNRLRKRARWATSGRCGARWSSKLAVRTSSENFPSTLPRDYTRLRQLALNRIQASHASAGHSSARQYRASPLPFPTACFGCPGCVLAISTFPQWLTSGTNGSLQAVPSIMRRFYEIRADARDQSCAIQLLDPAPDARFKVRSRRDARILDVDALSLGAVAWMASLEWTRASEARRQRLTRHQRLTPRIGAGAPALLDIRCPLRA